MNGSRMTFLNFTLVFITIMIKYFLAKTQGTNTGFFVKFEGHVLKAKPLRETKVLSDFDCGITCKRYEECLSFNFASKADQEGWHSCRLLATNESHGLLIDSTKFHYFKQIKISRFLFACDSQPCLNGGTCTESGGDPRYSCDCLPGFKGVNCETVKWIKFNKSPVAVGTKNEQHGTIYIPMNGSLITIKVAFVSGYVTRYKDRPETRSHWYANERGTGRPLPGLGILIAQKNRDLVIPEMKHLNDQSQHSYTIPGYNSMSPEIQFKNFTNPRRVRRGERLDVWYRQDYINVFEIYCDGTVKIDVYGLYV